MLTSKRRLSPLWTCVLLVGMRMSVAAEPRNVILIMADDLSYDTLGAYGSKQFSTPTLDRLAEEGVKFTHAYATPLCTPSRVTLMTGKSNVRNYEGFGALRRGEYTFAQLFEDAGYATAIAGKWQLHGTRKAKGTPPSAVGFDTYCLWNTGRTGGARYWNPSIDRDGTLLKLADGAYGPDVFTDFVVEFIEANRDRPFFVYYPMVLVHDPFVPTPQSRNRNARNVQQNFREMVSYMDEIVARIRETLRTLGIEERTVLIFTADNGTDRRIRYQRDGRVVRGGKGWTHDGGTHVPLIVHAKGALAGGRVIDDLVSFSDLLPTLADVIGVELPERIHVDGRSFWPQMMGEPGNPREWIYTYYFPHPLTNRTIRRDGTRELRYAQDARYKLYDDGRLYDLTTDRLERRPVRLGYGGDEAVAARRKLERVLASFPLRGEAIAKRAYRRR